MRIEPGQPVTAEARIRPLRPSGHAPVFAVVDEWWGGRPMARMLPRLFSGHFAGTSFAADRDGALAGFLVGLEPGDAQVDGIPVATGYDGPGQDRVRFVRDLPS